MKTFYVCSYGGCGSTLLARQLSRYGRVKHVHSRSPPDKLQLITNEQFNGIEVHPKDHYVIYIYKNPVKAILSRFRLKQHLQHVGCGPIDLNDVLAQAKDLYKIQEFYDNYTRPNPNRNYTIYCIKYESMFDRQGDLSRVFNIGPLNLVKKESDHQEDEYHQLYIIYHDLLQQMAKNDFLFLRPGKPPRNWAKLVF